MFPHSSRSTISVLMNTLMVLINIDYKIFQAQAHVVFVDVPETGPVV